MNDIRRQANSVVRFAGVPRFIASLALATLVALFGSGLLFGQQLQQASPLTLRQAVNIALEKNPQRKAALADTRAATADVKQARSFLLPHVTFSETATAGDDPVFVFGSKLRQQRFGASDFALNVLNTPLPFGNYSTRFGGTWNLFDSLASWRSVNRAEREKDATDRQLERTGQEIVFRVTDSYYAVLLAKKQLEVAEQAMKTAEAILERSKNRVESGIVVESDSLSAQVRLATRKQELIRAQNNVALARAQLSAAMGLSTQSDFEPADELTERNLPATPLEELEKQAIEKRPDLKRIRSEESAQQESVSIAKSSFGPRVNAFADWEADNPTLVGGGGNNWVAGIELQIDLFEGGAKQAQLSRERAMQEKVAATREMATDAVRLEVRRAYYDVDATRQQLEVARAAIAQSQESLRINQDRYEAGLSTVTDLLAAEEAARRTQADYWETLCRYYTGYAALELASGALNPQSPVVTP
ncbi:MAG: TolC family protein [Candidatus Acidiferrales bacterium]